MFNKDRLPHALLCLIRVMKLTTFFLLITFISVNASVYSQGTKLNVKVQSTSVKDVLSRIEDQSQFFFMYNDRKIDVERKVDIDLKQAKIEDLLNTIFDGTNTKFVIKDRQIVLYNASDEEFRFQNYEADSQQQKSVSGKVTDSSGSVLPGVSIIVKGTTIGTITDGNGNFSLSNLPEGATLQLSFIGMKTQEVAVSGKSTLSITMMEDAIAIDEVVAIGYGTTKKSDLTGSVTKVVMNEMKDIPTNSIATVLQGRAAGLQVISSSEDPGAGTTIRIRGASSLRGSNSPLVVIDGFPLGIDDLQQVNPSDIESIEILKDASASAIYGSRGANGVIIVTTKRAQLGRTKISIQQQVTVSEFTSKLDLWRNPVLMAQLNNESRINGGFAAQYIGEVSPTGIYYPSVEELSNGEWPYYTRWDDIVFRKNPTSNNTTLNISSSNEKTNFNLSGNYYTDKGVYIEDDYSKLNYNVRISQKIFDNLKVTFSNVLTSGKRNNNGGLAYWRSPIIPIYNEDGSYYRYNSSDFEHPIAITENRINKTKSLDVLSFLDTEFKIVPSLTLTSRLNYKSGSSINDQYQPKLYTQTGEYNKGAASISNYQGNTFVSETFLNFNKTFGKVHQLGAMIGHSYQNDVVRTSDLYAYDFVNETLNNENLAAGNPELNALGNSLTKTQLVSGIFRANYIYDNKYLLTITTRADGSSKFGDNNKWAYFPSGALSWKAHEENFVKNLDFFDELKIRGSYGISGNQGISPYQTLSRYGISKYFNDGNWVTAIGPGMEVGRTGQDGIEVLWGGIPNPDLRWETTAQTDIGVDMGILNNRLQIIFDYYDKRTDDLLQQRILPTSSGYDRMLINDGSIVNKGIELTLEGKIISTRDFHLNSTLIFSRNRNEVTNLGNTQESGLITDKNTGMQYQYYGNSIEMFRGYPNILAIGQPVNAFYGYVTDGIVQSLEEGITAGLEGTDAQPGEFKYVDIDGSGTIDENERKIIADPNPDFTASLNISMNYKNFDASIFFNGVFGNDVLNTKAFGSPHNSPLRWTMDNPTNDYPSLRDGRQVKFSDWWIEDGSFVRIQNLNLGYTMDLKSKVTVRLFMNASNLFTFTKFDGYDPEVGTDGRYYGGYPRLRKWSFGLNLTF